MAASAFNIFRLAGDLLHVISIYLLWTKIQKTRTCSGLSLKSQLFFFIVYVTRYLDLLHYLFLGFLSADFKHHYNALMKCLFIGSQSMVLYYMWFRFRPTYNAKLDTLRMEYVLVPCIVLGYFFMDSPHHHGIFSLIREVGDHEKL